VVANAVLALTEIQESDESSPIFLLDSTTLSRLLVALGECTEWGRIAILGAVAKYKAEDEKEAEHICERVIPQFQHANGSVVLAAIKVRHVSLRDQRITFLILASSCGRTGRDDSFGSDYEG